MPARVANLVPYLGLAAISTLLLLFSVVACGSADTSEEVQVTKVKQVANESEESGASGASGSDGAAGPAATAAPSAPRAAPGSTAAPAATAATEQTSERVVAVSEQGTTGFFQNAPLTDEAQSSAAPQNRIIVRTVDMGIIVPNVARSTDEILGMTRRYGGWLVSSDRSRKHQAALSVRVPAESLEEFVLDVRAAADGVEHETSTSQDVTDEFVDNQARLNGLRSTEARLLAFLEQAVNVEEALNVQVELARIQLEIEEIQGRLRFMAEVAAFSLVNLTLTTKPGEMPVDIGLDDTFRAGLPTVFRATFRPPEGVDEFKFTWHFGDGSRPVEGTRTAPTTNPGDRVTATVSHTYTNVDQSPYIVQMSISGIGDAGLFLGTDTLIATVTQIPGIEVFAGEDRVVDEGDDVEYAGSFTRPESLRDFRYRWDFGDGSATVFEVPDEDETRAVAKHTFPDYRPDPYPVVLTVIAQSDAGEIRGTSTFNVRVNEVEGFVVAGWDIGSTFKSAVRALSVVGQVVLTILIWVGIFSPVWLAVIAVVIFIPRIRRRFGWGLGGVPPTPMPPGPWQPRQFEAVPASPIGTAPHPAPEPTQPPQTATVAEGEAPDIEEEEQPTLLCSNCGVVFPATNQNGQPARFCPSCGAEAPSADDEERPPNP